MILLYNKYPNDFTKNLISKFVYYWCASEGNKSINREFDGISKAALKILQAYNLDCKDWKRYKYWKNYNEEIKRNKNEKN